MELKTVIIKSTDEAFDDAKQIRTDVFVKEQGFEVEFDDTDDTAWHFVVYDGDKAVGTARMYGEGDTLHIGRVAVIKDCRGKDIGAYIMRQAELFAKEQKAAALQLSAQVRARRFYEKCGYTAVGEEYLDEYCPHIDMIKKI